MSGADEFPYPGDDPSSLSGLGAVFDLNKSLLDSVSRSVGEADSSLTANWTADAATEASSDLITLKTALSRGSTAFGDCSTAVDACHRSLVSIRGQVDDLRVQLDRKETLLMGQQTEYARADRFGEINDMTPAQIASYRSVIAGDEQTTRTAISGLTDQYNALVRQANTATSTCSDALRASVTSQAYQGTTLVSVPFTQALGLTNLGLLQDFDFNAAKNPPQWPTDTSPAAVLAYWNSLPPELRAAYIRLYPEQVGNMNGVPIVDRSTANVSVATADRSKVDAALQKAGYTEAQYLQLVADNSRGLFAVQAALSAAGVDAGDLTRFTNAIACLDGMTKDSNAANGAPTYLMIYDPTAYGGKGRAAIAIGNPDTADNTAVCVPGLKQQVSNDMGNPDASNLYNQMSSSDPSQSNAVVQWMGYDAPGFSNVASENAAENGAKNLAADVAALQATHLGTGHLTVVGHSYGSTTTADAAAMYGMHPDDIVLIGSPGAGHAHSAADLGLPPGHVYDGAASHDEITHVGNEFGALGNDPAAASFGATRFHAESVDRGDDSFGISDHSRYYQVKTDDNGNTVPSESLQNISDVATGHGGDISTDGEATGGRYQKGTSYEARGQSHSVSWYQDDEYNYQPKWGDPTK